VTFRVVDAAAEVAVNRIPELLGEIERRRAVVWPG